MQTLQRGQKLKWDTLSSSNHLHVGVAAKLPAGVVLDYSCFGVDEQNRLSDERYFIFYNQTSSPEGALAICDSADGDSARFSVDLGKLPTNIRRLVFVVTIDGSGSMNALQSGHWRLYGSGGDLLAEFPLRGSDFAEEKAIIAGEFYFKDSWRTAAVGQGFNGGLSALLKHFGGEEATETPAPPTPVPAPAKSSDSPSAKLSLEKKLEKAAPHLLSLAKPLKVSLEKKKLENIVARVALVLDSSGSMDPRFRSGAVQTVVDRIFPLAVHFDDNGEFDVWAFAEEHQALTPVSSANVKGFIERDHGGWKLWRLGARQNNEPSVIRAVTDAFRDSKLPAYVIFISDGGVRASKEIERLIVEASNLPIFWQFVGLGGKKYGILERLDTMSGRVIDNCNFFALDDIQDISEEELYDRLLAEFPQWLREAKAKGFISGS